MVRLSSNGMRNRWEYRSTVPSSGTNRRSQNAARKARTVQSTSSRKAL